MRPPRHITITLAIAIAIVLVFAARAWRRANDGVTDTPSVATEPVIVDSTVPVPARTDSRAPPS